MSEVIEYVLLPYNDDAVIPRALNTFIHGLAELRISKCLIKNEYSLAELMERVYQEKDSERLLTKKCSPKAVILKMGQNQLLNIANTNSQKTLIWNVKKIHWESLC